MLAESFIALAALMTVQGAEFREPQQVAVHLNSLPVAKYAARAVRAPIKVRQDSYGVDVSARAAAVLDVASGEVLLEKDAQSAYPIASLTKLMTAITFLDSRPDLKQEVTLADEDDPHEGKSVFLNGERFSKGELLQALLVGSVNTAGNTIARVTGGKDVFVGKMNQKARELGLRQATFAEPTGLDPNNRASARDVAIMLRTAMSYPIIREATEQNKLILIGRATGHAYEIKSTNLLLDSFLNKAPYEIVTAKTGSLPEAGFCLAQVTRRNGAGEVIAVVLGSQNHFARFQDAKALTYWAFQTYEWPKSQARVY